MQHPDITGPTALGVSVSFAGLAWVNNLELVLRLLALVLSIAASWYAIKHYRNK
jgi:hypothetical protein